MICLNLSVVSGPDFALCIPLPHCKCAARHTTATRASCLQVLQQELSREARLRAEVTALSREKAELQV